MKCFFSNQYGCLSIPILFVLFAFALLLGLRDLVNDADEWLAQWLEEWIKR